MSDITAGEGTNGRSTLVARWESEAGSSNLGQGVSPIGGEGFSYSTQPSGASTGEQEAVPADARYYELGLMSRRFGTALRLLREANTHVEQALTSAREGDSLVADDAVYAVKPIMQELFLCRALGDGFALTVSGLLASFRNLAGQPMSLQQLQAVAAAVMKLRMEPLLSVQVADDILDRLEEKGLNPNLPGLTDLVAAVVPHE